MHVTDRPQESPCAAPGSDPRGQGSRRPPPPPPPLRLPSCCRGGPPARRGRARAPLLRPALQRPAGRCRPGRCRGAPATRTGRAAAEREAGSRSVPSGRLSRHASRLPTWKWCPHWLVIRGFSVSYSYGIRWERIRSQGSTAMLAIVSEMAAQGGGRATRIEWAITSRQMGQLSSSSRW